MHQAALICLLCLPGAEEPESPINPTPQPTLREVVAEWDFAGDTGGWIAEAHCEIAATDGNLAVRATAKDPYMHVRVDVTGGQMALEYRARSTAPSPAQIYWITRESPRRGEDKVRSFETIADNEWHDYAVDFKARGQVTDIRLDPADNAGEIEIDWIRLVRLGEHPLSIERVDVTAAGAQFTLKNHGAEPRQCTASGQAMSLEAGAEKTIVVPLDAVLPVEAVRFVLQTPDLPDVQRSLFVMQPEAPVAWLDLPLDDG